MPVEHLSNSLISGNISVAAVTYGFGHMSLTTCAAIVSFFKLANPFIKKTQTASHPISNKLIAAAFTSSVSTGMFIVPSANVRSLTSNRISLDTIGSNIPQRPQVVGRSLRRISKTSRKPLVVIIPVLAPFRSNKALVPTVVP